MALVRSIIYALIYYPGTAITTALAFFAVPFGSDAVIAGARRWARWHRWCAQMILGIRTRVIGDLPQSGVFYVIKHETSYETIETLVLLDRPAVVMKRELFGIIGWGQVARAHGAIPVDREAGSVALRALIAAGRSAKAAGRPVVLFPEGTRVPHGERPPLRAGFAGLYKILGLPVIPIALDSGKLMRGRFIKHSGVVTMLVGEPIPPGLPREVAEARVHAAINALNAPVLTAIDAAQPGAADHQPQHVGD